MFERNKNNNTDQVFPKFAAKIIYNTQIKKKKKISLEKKKFENLMYV